MNGKRNILFVDKDAYPSLEEPELFDTLAAGAGMLLLYIHDSIC